MSQVFGRSSAAGLPVVERGEGMYLVDTNGKRYLDACGGAAVSCLGHGHTPLLEAVKGQVDRIAYAHTSFFTSEPAEKLATKLVAHAPPGIERVYFVSGGSESVEAAIKLARQYHVETGASQRTEIIARKQSYHGNTLGALSAGGNLWRRRQFEPLLSKSMHHIDPCYYWRWGQANETAEQYAARVAAQLEEKILELGADRVAAFIAEPVVGATLGAVHAEPGYFTEIRKICDRYGVLLILDEVMCGMGRTGYLFACEADDVRPDIVCIAKGLGAGVQPIGAMLCSGSIYTAIESGSGFFQHGHTYLAHPAACAAGLAVMDCLLQREDDKENLIQSVQRRGEDFIERLKKPLDPSLRLHAKLKSRAFANGLMIYPMGGTVDGRSGDHVLLAPPFIATDADLENIVDLLETSVNEVLSE